MRTMRIRTDDGEVVVHHNSDWSGDAYVAWEERGTPIQTRLPASALLAAGKAAALEHVTRKLTHALEQMEMPGAEYVP